MSSNYARAGLGKSIASTLRDAGFTGVVRPTCCFFSYRVLAYRDERAAART